MDVLFFLLFILGCFPFWVFIPSALIYKALREKEYERPSDWTMTIRLAWLVGNIASLASLTYTETAHWSMWSLGGSSVMRGWPLPWIGLGFASIIAPVTLIGDILVWFIVALCVLGGIAYLGAKINRPGDNVRILSARSMNTPTAGEAPRMTEDGPYGIIVQLWSMQKNGTHFSPFNMTYSTGVSTTPDVQPVSITCRTKPYRRVEFGK